MTTIEPSPRALQQRRLSARRRIAFMLAASTLPFVGLVAGALTLEGLTRVAYYFGSRRFIHTYLGETQKPDHRRTDVTPEGHPFVYSTNNYGFRGGQIPDRKPSGARYVFTLGGSTTACNEYPHEQTWPGILEQRLRQVRGDDRIHVFNAGMGSATSYHSLVVFLNQITRLNADLVIVYEGINDKPPFYPSSARYFRDIGHGEDFLHRPSYLLYEFALHVRSSFSTRLARALYPPALETQGFAYHEKNYRDIAYLARGYQVRVVFMTQPIMPHVLDARGMPESNDAINTSTRVLGEELNVPVFDLAAVMPVDSQYFLPDGVHYTRSGNVTIGTELASWLLARGLP